MFCFWSRQNKTFHSAESITQSISPITFILLQKEGHTRGSVLLDFGPKVQNHVLDQNFRMYIQKQIHARIDGFVFEY
jgi:hypothetical protein